jgi:exportin-2 (importin alpha re-exporter)
MRIIVGCKDDMNPFMNQIMSRFTNLIYTVSKNPSNPRFNHYLFEAVSGLVRYVFEMNLVMYRMNYSI